MAKIDQKVRFENMQRFLKLASEMTSAGVPPETVSAALMSASAVCATQVTLGSKGSLNQKGIDAISGLYRKQMTLVQKTRQAASARREEQRIRETVEEIVSFPEDD